MSPLSRTEEMLLLMVCKLQEEAYGMQIRDEVRNLTGKLYSIGGIYVPLDRLVSKGYLKMMDISSDAERMGRPRRRFVITSEGLSILKKTKELEEAMWNLPPSQLQKIRI